MGLLGNVAEVPHLRPKLMTRAFVAEFAMLLDSNLDGIEVRIGFQSSCIIAFLIVSRYLCKERIIANCRSATMLQVY